MTSEKWEEVRFEDFLSIKRGHDLPKRIRRPGGIPVVGSSGRSGWHDEARVDGPSLTIGRSGNIGALAWEEKNFWPLNTVLYVTHAHGNDLKFAYYLLHTVDFQKFNSGSVQPSLNRNFLAGHKLRIPPIEEQRAIAEVLGALDDRIEWAARLGKLVHVLACALAEAHEPVAAVPLADFAELRREMISADSLDDELWSHYSIPAFDEGQEPVIEPGDGIRSGKYRVPDACVLVSKLNPTWHRVWLPASQDVPRAICSTEFMPVVPKERDLLAPLWAALLSANLNRQMRERVTGSTGSHQRVRPEDLMACKVADVRTLDTDSRHVLDALAERLLLLRGERRRLASTRDALLPKLLSGELRIKDPSRLVGVAA